MNLHAFDISLLLETITLQLSLDDIFQCTLVSKQWNSWFTPSLWHTIDLGNLCLQDLDHFHSALEHNCHHVRSLLALGNSITPGYATPILNRLLNFLGTLTRLQEFTVLYLDGKNDVPSRLIASLNSLPMLKKLNLVFYDWINSIFVLEIIMASQKVESLRLEISNPLPEEGGPRVYPDQEQEQERSQMAKDAIEQMQDTKIKELTTALFNSYQEQAILPALLDRCPLLSRLYMKTLHSPAITLPLISSIFRKKRHTTRLRHLELGVFNRQDDIDDAIMELLSILGCSNNSGHERDVNWVNKTYGLESFGFHSPILDRRSTLTLIQGHSHSLSSLLMPGVNLPFGEFVLLMSGLSRLRTLNIGPVIEDGRLDDENINALFRIPWTCLGLTILTLKLVLRKGRQSKNDKTWRKWKPCLQRLCTDYIFSQLARLEELEEWRMASTFHFLTIKNGYLGQLSKLQKLKKLYLRRMSVFSRSYPLASDEGRWMVENWPSLEYIEVYERDPVARQGILDMQGILRAHNASIRFKF